MAIRTLSLTMGAAPTTTYLGDTAAAATRNALVDYHLTPIADGLADGENVFQGFTDTTGFTDVVCTSGDELRAAIMAQTIGQKRRYLCRWNGLSEITTGTTIDVLSSSAYTVNGAVDWGYTRPAHSVWITADTGYAPILGVSAAAPGKVLSMRGYNWLHFDNIGFQCALVIGRTASLPGLAILAITNCTFSNLDVENIGLFYRAIQAIACRTLHLEGCTFDDCFGVASVQAEYFRAWNNIVRDGGPQDIFNGGSFDRGTLQSGWVQNVWLFGNLIYDHDTRTRTPSEGSGYHTDFWQCLHPLDAQPRIRMLMEFNVVAMNSSNVADQPKSQFIQAGPGGNAEMIVDWVMHNNIGVIGAFNVQNLTDSADAGDKFILHNTFARHGQPPDVAGGAYNSFTQMTFARAKVIHFDGETAPFTVDQRITGGTSGAAAFIASITKTSGTAGYMLISAPFFSSSLTFQDNETITDPLGGSALVNGAPVDPPAGTTGILRIRNNVVSSISGGVFNNEDIANNALVDPRAGVNIDPQDFFEGNGTWGTTPVQGYQTYTDPAVGAASAAAARTAIYAFYKPKAAYGGWNDLTTSGRGVTNPANWPATPPATIA